MKKPTTTPKKGNEKLALCFTLFFLFLQMFTYAQKNDTPEYRALTAYIDDFAKNELYIKKALIEYSNTIVENQLENRTKSTALRIIEKLKNINSIIKKNDQGYKKNTLLRDSFIKMNEKTIECMSNGTLIMNDYVSQSQLSVTEINKNLKQRELNLKSYFDELKAFEKSKKEFGKMNNINIKNFSGTNILEYNAFQNILFYKINVLDEKLNATIFNINNDDFNETITAIENTYKEVVLKTTQYKTIVKDNSLNNENVNYSNFIFTQKKKVIPLFNDFANENKILKKLKTTTDSNSNESITLYNQTVKSYNLKKNKLFDMMETIQANKKVMYDKWFAVNRTFLKNNIKIDDIYESYTYND